MSFRAIAVRAVLTSVVQLASFPVFVDTSGAQQPLSIQPDPEEAEHIRLSAPILRAWLEIPVGSPVYALDDAARAQDWLERISIERIVSAGEGFRVRIEPGYSVFTIYPYLRQGYHCHVCQGMYLKVNGNLSEDDLIAAIRDRTPSIKIDEYEVFGLNAESIYRHRDRTLGRGFDAGQSSSGRITVYSEVTTQ